MNVQEAKQIVFNAAYNGLRSQGWQKSMSDVAGSMADGVASSESSECAYRGDGGRKCAIGWCIRDEAYRVSFEDKRPSLEIVRAMQPEVAEWFSYEHANGSWVVPAFLRFLADLQMCHDGASTSADMILRMDNFALAHGLGIPSTGEPE